ncbi:hypothetical protein NL390_33200, partial [Klebsiella pneumoniae]|nr:hypothetical protein [Klebsiella pneumoniae]
GQVGSITAGRTAVEASSSNARAVMLWEGTALLFESPIFGYGPGLGALALNFRNPDGVLTLDNYLLILALDCGVIPVILFVGIVF